ncbi:restriction endonuclease subunit S [Vibrio cyclitrophicus]|uniref:restriction endonuclease subunit S n=1 Tax=Vibrio cyclitrophicus TaxID=47951 RepID=UPI00029A0903|nr:restriction endonuclease subunit S [Vibrio cyclitrophicus]OEE25794.1 hypothetical protein OAM_03725 [Vibrio cyclitrophicus ZF14]
MTEQMNVPKLRFGEFEGKWNTKKVKDICPLQRGFDLPTTQVVAGEYPVVYSNGIGRFHAEYKAKAPGIVTGRSGTIGNLTFVEHDYWPHNTSLWVTNFFDNDVKFIFYLLNKLDLKRFSTGSGVPTLNRNDVHAHKTTVPNPREQQKIASFLSKVDEKIGLLSEKKDKLTEYKRGVMQQLFNCKWQEQGGQLTFMPPTLRFKADDGSEFPDWEEKTLGDVINFFNGKGHEKNIDPKGQYIVVNSKFVSSQSKVKKFCNELISPLNKNDITMVMSDVPNGKALAKCYLIPENNRYTLNQRICALRSNGLTVNKFLIYQLNRNEYYLKFDSGVGQTNLKKNEVLSCPLSIPSLREQTKIANFLSAIDQKITLANSELEKAKEWKKGLLQQMFV